LDILSYIKRLLLQGRVIFTVKAEGEMYRNGLSDDDVIEAIINAPAIYKKLRSKSDRRRTRREMLYVIVGATYNGVVIYTKGTIRKQARRDVFYVLVSAKRALDSD
jgi:hypothetical protein